MFSPRKAGNMQDTMTDTDSVPSSKKMTRLAMPKRCNNSPIPREFTNDGSDGCRERAALATVFGVREYTEPKVLWERPANETEYHNSSTINVSGYSLQKAPSLQTERNIGYDSDLTDFLEDFKLPEIPVVSEFNDLLDPDYEALSERNERGTKKAIVDYRIFDLLGSNNDDRIIVWDLDPNAISASLATTQHTQSIQNSQDAAAVAAAAQSGFSSNTTLPTQQPVRKHRSMFSAHLFSTRRTMHDRSPKSQSTIVHPSIRWRKNSKNNGQPGNHALPPAKPESLPNVIGAATVEKLVEKLTDTLDYTFMTDFFLTYRSFVSSVQLCNLLILRFRWSLESEDEVYCIARVRTFVVLRHWLLNYFVHDFIPCRELRIVLTSFLNALPYHPLIKNSSKNRRIVKGLKRVVRRLKKVYFRGSADNDHVRVIAPPPPTSAQERVEEMVRATLSQSTIRRKTAIIGGINVVNRHNGNMAVQDASMAPVVVIGNVAEEHRDTGHSLDLRLPSKIIGRGNTITQRKTAKESYEQRLFQQLQAMNDDKESVNSTTIVSSPQQEPSSRRSSIDTCDASLNSALSPGTTDADLESGREDEQSSYFDGHDPSQQVSQLQDGIHHHEQQITEQLTARLERERQRLEEEEERRRAAFFSPLECEDHDFDEYSYHHGQRYIGSPSSNPFVPALNQISLEQAALESAPVTPSTFGVSSVPGQQNSALEYGLYATTLSPGYELNNRLSKTLVEDDMSSIQSSLRLESQDHRAPYLTVAEGRPPFQNFRKMPHPLPSPPAQDEYRPFPLVVEDRYASKNRQLIEGFVDEKVQVTDPSQAQSESLREWVAKDIRDSRQCTGGQGCQCLSVPLWHEPPDHQHSVQFLMDPTAINDQQRNIEEEGHDERCSSRHGAIASNETNSMAMYPRQQIQCSPPVVPEHAYQPVLSLFHPEWASARETEELLYRRSFLLSHRSRQVAEQLCLIERDVLLYVDWEEMVHCGWTRMSLDTSEKDPQGIIADHFKDTNNLMSEQNRYQQVHQEKGIEQVIKRFNAACQWVASEIVRTFQVEERARLIGKFIRLAQKCRQFSNYATLVQILLGLQSPSVTRLEKTWARVDRREKALLEELSEFTSPIKNWKHIRDDMTEVAEEFGMSPTEIQIEMPGTNVKERRQTRIKLPFGGCVPFLGIYLSDLVFNSEQPTYLEPTSASRIYHSLSTSQPSLFNQPLVNFRKYRVIATVIKRVLTLQNLARRYSFEREEELYAQCFHLDALDVDTIRQLSLDIEP